MNEILWDAPGVNDDDSRTVLAAQVKAARMAKFRTVDAARVAAGVARGTWEKVERGDSVKEFSLGAIEKALGWQPGHATRVLAGDTSAPAPMADAAESDIDPQDVAATLRAFDRRLAEIEARLANLDDAGVSEQRPSLRSVAKNGDIEPDEGDLET